MIGNLDFAIGAVKATEEIGYIFNPKIQFVHFKGEKAIHAIDMMDHFLLDIRKANKLLKESIEEIKSYTVTKAKKCLKDIYPYEDLMQSLLDSAKSIKPYNQKEEILLNEFISFCETFIGIVGLHEVMALSSSQRDRIFSKDKKASQGSRVLTPKDLLD